MCSSISTDTVRGIERGDQIMLCELRKISDWLSSLSRILLGEAYFGSVGERVARPSFEGLSVVMPEK